MKAVLLISRIFAGAVFVFSGFVKAVDPMGFAIKLTEYYDAFHLGFLHFSALPLAIIMCAAELMIGLNLLMGVRLKFTSWLLLLFMVYFTVLTFILALFNPVSDCGCFGDAVKLTNWQTFGKNVILMVPTLILFVNRKKITVTWPWINRWEVALFNLAVGCALAVYGLLYEPMIDFRPYKTGTHIPDQMVIPAGAPLDVYETRLVYQKNGVKKEFTEQDYPWQDTTWKWVETKKKLIKKGYVPPIHDFSITSLTGEDLTDSILNDTSLVFLFISPQIEKASAKSIRKLKEIADRGIRSGYKVFAVTSSVEQEIENFKADYKPSWEICIADETTLKTMARTNPAIMVLHTGTVVGKWSYRNVPREITWKALR
jgi:uncharacterized membrane protein YphA (DoxX/SURF4 family)